MNLGPDISGALFLLQHIMSESSKNIRIFASRVISSEDTFQKIMAADCLYLVAKIHKSAGEAIARVAVPPFSIPNDIPLERGAMVSEGLMAGGLLSVAEALRDKCGDRTTFLDDLIAEITALCGPLERNSQGLETASSFGVYGSETLIPGRDRRLRCEEFEPDPESVIEQLHTQAFNIEVCAMEICAYLVIKYPEMPLELTYNLVRQTWDEARHARILLEQMTVLGGCIGDFPISMGVWEKAVKAGSLVESLCIEQVLGEGFAIGADLFLAERYRRLGHPKLSAIHHAIHVDEVNHAREGIIWVLRLSQGDIDDLLLPLEATHGAPPIAGEWFNEELRRYIGFTDAQIERQRKLSYHELP